jgi:hypothetical protein
MPRTHNLYSCYHYIYKADPGKRMASLWIGITAPKQGAAWIKSEKQELSEGEQQF